jgi:hypothetical protein
LSSDDKNSTRPTDKLPSLAKEGLQENEETQNANSLDKEEPIVPIQAEKVVDPNPEQATNDE